MVSTHKQLVRLRRVYTSESWQQVLAGMASSGGRVQLPPASAQQAQFEVDLMSAIRYGVEPRNPETGHPQPFGLHAVHPRRDGLVLDLARSRADRADIIGRVTPVYVGKGADVGGVSGLRTRFLKDRTVLFDVHTGARVVVRNVTRDVWELGLRDYYGSDVAELRLLHERFDGPLPEEADFYEEFQVRHRTTSPGDALANSILSGLLRRAHIFRASQWMEFVDLWWNWSGEELTINVEWAGDLTHSEVIDRLVHPVFGLPFTLNHRGNCLCEPCMLRDYSVDMRDTVIGSICLALRRSRMYDPDRRVPPECSGDTALSLSRRERWTRPLTNVGMARRTSTNAGWGVVQERTD